MLTGASTWCSPVVEWTGGRSYLMKGLTTVMRALTYQAGWTTRRPFRSFFSLDIMTAFLV